MLYEDAVSSVINYSISLKNMKGLILPTLTPPKECEMTSGIPYL